jgi:hypothetical protein
MSSNSDHWFARNGLMAQTEIDAIIAEENRKAALLSAFDAEFDEEIPVDRVYP